MLFVISMFTSDANEDFVVTIPVDLVTAVLATIGNVLHVAGCVILLPITSCRSDWKMEWSNRCKETERG